MALRVGDCALVQRIEGGGRSGLSSATDALGVWLARDETADRWVIADVRMEETLQLPDEALDAELAGRPGLLVPSRRARSRGNGLVALVEPLRPRQSLRSLRSLRPLDVRDAAALFADLLESSADLLTSDISVGLLSSRDLVLVQDGQGAARLVLSTGCAKRTGVSVTASRNLSSVLNLLPALTAGSAGATEAPSASSASSPVADPSNPSTSSMAASDQQWTVHVRALVRAAHDGTLSPQDAAAALRALAGSGRPVVTIPALPRLPGADPGQGGPVPVAAGEPRRRVGPLEVAAGLVGLACVAAVVVVLQTDAGTPAPIAPPNSSATTDTLSQATTPTQPPPADAAAAGRPCAFYDVGVLDRAGTEVLQCVLQANGTYLWESGR